MPFKCGWGKLAMVGSNHTSVVAVAAFVASAMTTPPASPPRPNRRFALLCPLSSVFLYARSGRAAFTLPLFFYVFTLFCSLVCLVYLFWYLLIGVGGGRGGGFATEEGGGGQCKWVDGAPEECFFQRQAASPGVFS